MRQFRAGTPARPTARFTQCGSGFISSGSPGSLPTTWSKNSSIPCARRYCLTGPAALLVVTASLLPRSWRPATRSAACGVGRALSTAVSSCRVSRRSNSACSNVSCREIPAAECARARLRRMAWASSETARSSGRSPHIDFAASFSSSATSGAGCPENASHSGPSKSKRRASAASINSPATAGSLGQRSSVGLTPDSVREVHLWSTLIARRGSKQGVRSFGRIRVRPSPCEGRWTGKKAVRFTSHQALSSHMKVHR